jgi:gliding motility-associated-like protein
VRQRGKIPFNTKTIIHILTGTEIIKTNKSLSQGWDGTFNGQLMPATDYWYSIELQDGRVLADILH